MVLMAQGAYLKVHIQGACSHLEVLAVLNAAEVEEFGPIVDLCPEAGLEWTRQAQGAELSLAKV